MRAWPILTADRLQPRARGRVLPRRGQQLVHVRAHGGRDRLRREDVGVLQVGDRVRVRQPDVDGRDGERVQAHRGAPERARGKSQKL